MAENRNALPTGTVLNSRYEIRRFIGGGSFGLVYLAKDSRSGFLFAIKELFPGQLTVREGESVRLALASGSAAYGQALRQFRKEGKHLVDLGRHEGIVGRHDYFEGNNTGYLVMDYVEGKPLRDLMEYYKKRGESFSQKEIMDLLSPLLDGLGHVHRSGLAHLDIKPENILLRRKDEKPVLLDFGAARNTAGHSTGSSLLIGTPPYAPFEQEQKMGDRGPWSDIYALGIMLYEIAFGDKADSIPDSKDRVLKDTLRPAALRGEDSKCDRRLLRLIDRCVKMEIKDRPRSVEELEDLLKQISQNRYRQEDDSIKPKPFPAPPDPPKRSSAAGRVVALMAALLALSWWITFTYENPALLFMGEMVILVISWTGMRYGPEFFGEFFNKSMASAFAALGADAARTSAGLMVAALKGHTDTARRLIAAGADVNARDDYGRTALMVAALKGHTDIARRLIAAGAGVNARDDYGYTALMEATKGGHTDIARRLIAAGADVNARDDDGETALMRADRAGHTDIARLLKRAGVRR